MGFDEGLVASVVQSRFLMFGAPHSCLSALVSELVDETALAEEESVPQTPGTYTTILYNVTVKSWIF